jgi:hypothetical protein
VQRALAGWEVEASHHRQVEQCWWALICQFFLLHGYLLDRDGRQRNESGRDEQIQRADMCERLTKYKADPNRRRTDCFPKA